MSLWPQGYPAWKDLQRHLLAEFLPATHPDNLEDLYHKLRQKGSLTTYQTKWHDLMNAISEAGIEKYSKTDKVKAFINGLRKAKQMLWFQISGCHTMSDITTRALELKTAKETADPSSMHKTKQHYQHSSRTDLIDEWLSTLKGSALNKKQIRKITCHLKSYYT